MTLDIVYSCDKAVFVVILVRVLLVPFGKRSTCSKTIETGEDLGYPLI